MYCDDQECQGPIKPKIIFFGEDTEHVAQMCDDEEFKSQWDLQIILGTSLKVGPFNRIVDGVEVPQVLINMENTAHNGYDFCDVESRPDRLFLEGQCDDIIEEISKHCGWHEDLMKRFEADKVVDQTTKDMSELKL